MQYVHAVIPDVVKAALHGWATCSVTDGAPGTLESLITTDILRLTNEMGVGDEGSWR